MWLLDQIKLLLGLDTSTNGENVPGFYVWDNVLDVIGDDAGEVRAACRTLLGKVRYVWGGTDDCIAAAKDGDIDYLLPIDEVNLEKRGGDCSLVTLAILVYAGILPKGSPRYTTTTFRDIVDIVSADSLIPGDIAFYSGHVAVFVGYADNNVALVATMNGDSSNHGENPDKTLTVKASSYHGALEFWGRVRK